MKTGAALLAILSLTGLLFSCSSSESGNADDQDEGTAIDEADLLTPDNAESILRDIVSVANGEFIPQFAPIATEEALEMRAVFLDLISGTDSTLASDYVLIEGSTDEPSGSEFITNGGRYTCVGDGSAALINPFDGENGQGFTVSFDACVTPSSTLGAIATFDGRAQMIPRAGRGRAEVVSYDDFAVTNDGLLMSIDGQAQNVINAPSAGRFTANASKTVSSYSLITSDGIASTVENYSAVLASEYNPLIDDNRYIRRASADITFSATSASLGAEALTVTIDLALDESSDGLTLPELPIGQWASGGIRVDAPDGSSINAEPVADDPAMLRIEVDGETFERPWSDGFQVECIGLNTFGCQ